MCRPSGLAVATRMPPCDASPSESTLAHPGQFASSAPELQPGSRPPVVRDEGQDHATHTLPSGPARHDVRTTGRGTTAPPAAAAAAAGPAATATTPAERVSPATLPPAGRFEAVKPVARPDPAARRADDPTA